MTSSRTCLLTGADGFLGGWISRVGAERGYRVIDPGVWLPTSGFGDALAEIRPDVLVHAAGPSSVAGSFDDPDADFRGSVAATQCVLDAVRTRAPDACVVYLSSAAVYGNPTRLPITEDDALAPISPYGFHKAMCESLLRQYAQLHSVRTVAARIFSAYGPGLRRQVVHDLFRRARPAERLRLDGTGDESRDFVHGRDVASAIFALAERAPARGEAFNVATGDEVTMRQLAGAVREIAGTGDVEFTGVTRRGDPLRWRADVARLRGLGITPSVALREGLEQVHASLSADGALVTPR